MPKIDIDAFNIGLIVLSLIIAHIVPFELLLFSYAILGPAHYVTQISWLHQRNYFAFGKFDAIPLALLTAAILIFKEYYLYLMFLSVGWATSITLTKDLEKRLIGTVFITVLLYLLTLYSNVLYVWVFLPTLIHVFVFTASFMLFGALKAKSKIGVLSFFVLCIFGISFFVPGLSLELTPTFYAQENIVFLDSILNGLTKGADLGGAIDPFLLDLAGFAAFAYTYHYLNWFSKTKVIRWHEIPTHHAMIAAPIYIGAVGLYIYDYALGFKVLLFLSLLHVILEFPLNVKTFQGLGVYALAPLRRRS